MDVVVEPQTGKFGPARRGGRGARCLITIHTLYYLCTTYPLTNRTASVRFCYAFGHNARHIQSHVLDTVLILNPKMIQGPASMFLLIVQHPSHQSKNYDY
jgi:hypothetical protein